MYLHEVGKGVSKVGVLSNKLNYEKERLNAWINRKSRLFMKQPIVISMDETIAVIKQRRASIARYGDGEFDIIFGRTEGFQNKNQVLSERLREILKKNDVSDRFLVAIPDCFGDLSQFRELAQVHWRIRLDKERIKWVRCLNRKSPYYHAQITRFYFDWADKSKCKEWYAGLKNIWDNENVLVVEGEFSRVGVGNDLFSNAASIRRILCPAENAFDCYDEILKTICDVAKPTDLIFMALGPTATVLAYDLFQKGYWAIDAGHIDLEYEWMRLGASQKVKIAGKYVNEVKGGNVVAKIQDEEMLHQVIAKVGI